jgi:hypothetical protein
MVCEKRTTSYSDWLEESTQTRQVGRVEVHPPALAPREVTTIWYHLLLLAIPPVVIISFTRTTWEPFDPQRTLMTSAKLAREGQQCVNIPAAASHLPDQTMTFKY